jgi:hypothetical protein
MATYVITAVEGIFYDPNNDLVMVDETAPKGTDLLPESFHDSIEIHVFSSNEAAMAFESGLAIAAEMYGGEVMYLATMGLYRFAGKLRPAVAMRYASEEPSIVLVDNIKEG